MICIALPNHVEAATLIKKGSFKCVSDWGTKLTFTPRQSGYFVIYCEFFDSNGRNLTANDGLSVRVSGGAWWQTYFDFTWRAKNGWTGMWCCGNSNTILPQNEHVLVEFQNVNYYDSNSYLDVQYEIYLYKDLATSISMPSTIKLKTEQTQKINIKNQIPSGSYLDVEMISSNNKIATPYFDCSKHAWYVEAKQAGTCTLTAKLDNGKKYTCKVTVTNPDPKIKYSSCTMNTGRTLKNTVLYTNQKVKWSSSNKKIASVNSNGIIKANKIGKCTITAQIGKKKYKCTVNVVRRSPNFSGYIEYYYTRNNYFSVRIKNMGDASLTILPSGAKAKNFDYRSFDRNLKVSTTSIKPGATKTLKFKVQGRTTWYDYEDFWITYQFKYDGKTYTGNFYSDPEYSEFKNGGKYYYTYLGDDCGF